MTPRARALAAGITFLAGGCGDSGIGLEPVNLHLVISTAGVDKDADGYLLYGAAAPLRIVQADGELLLSVPAGEYEIRIDGIAPNCSAQSPATVSASVGAGGISTATFNLECRAVTASLRVVVPAAGRDFDFNGYAILVDGKVAGGVHSGDSVLVEGLSAGTHAVSLDDFSDNCGLSSGPGSVDVPLSVGAPVRDVGRVVFQITCQATTGDVRLTTTTRGTASDPNGYTVMVDDSLFQVAICPGPPGDFCNGREALRLAGNDSYLVPALSPGDHPFELRDIDGNCRVDGPTRRTVSVAAGAVAEIVFNVVCGAP